ncbi:MAG: N-acetyltransferase [Chloroflexi bacterium]|nr:MAG: N-acetyltransferase [Chloroflexota bacterium]
MQQYDLENGYLLIRAEKKLFAAYQTLYSNADTNLFYDWQMRLSDTLWSDNGFFLVHNNQKLGGAILHKNEVLFPFLIPPFCDRAMFYRQIQRALLMWRDPDSTELFVRNGLDADVEILLTLGYQRTARSRRGMIRPTDHYDVCLPAGFYEKPVSVEQSAAIANLLNQAYKGGINEQVFGPLTEADIQADIERLMATNTSDVSSLVYDAKTNLLVGACLAGVDPETVNCFAGIGQVGVLPQVQNRGLGIYMILKALSKAYYYSPAMCLFVTVGNPAESLYRHLGFIPGPCFTQMRFQLA